MEFDAPKENQIRPQIEVPKYLDTSLLYLEIKQYLEIGDIDSEVARFLSCFSKEDQKSFVISACLRNPHLFIKSLKEQLKIYGYIHKPHHQIDLEAIPPEIRKLCREYKLNFTLAEKLAALPKNLQTDLAVIISRSAGTAFYNIVDALYRSLT